MAADLSVIGRGTRVRARVSGAGDLEIQGHVEGEVGVDGDVTIDATALVAGNVSARRIVVRGAVRGDLAAEESIALERGARVVGDLRAARVGVAEGALVRGLVQAGDGDAVTVGALAARKATARGAQGGRAPAARASEPREVGQARAPAPRASEPREVARPAPPRAAAAPAPRNGTARGAGLLAGARMDEASSGSFDFDNAPTVARLGPSAVAPPAARPAGGPPPPVVPALKKGAKGQITKKRS